MCFHYYSFAEHLYLGDSDMWQPVVAMPGSRSISVRSLPGSGLIEKTVLGCPPMPAFSRPLTVRETQQHSSNSLTKQSNSQPAYQLEDIRSKKSKEEDQRSPSTLVNILNQYSRQGPGGQFDPEFLPLTYCILCKLGGACLGASCQGLGKSKKPQRCLGTGTTKQLTIPPGFSFLPHLANQPAKTPRSKVSLRKIKSFSPKSDIFNWNGKTTPALHHDHHHSIQKLTSVKAKHEKKPSTVKPSSPSISGRWLQMLLLNCGRKVRKESPSKVPHCSPSPSKSSADRKIMTGEKMCERKSSTRNLPPLVSTLDRFVNFLISLRVLTMFFCVGLHRQQEMTRLQ